MDLSTLRDLAVQGFTAVRGDQLGALAEWCQDYSEATGDARYASVGQGLDELFEWWSEHDRSGGIPLVLRNEIEETIKSRLPLILATTDPADAAPLARDFRQELESKLYGPRYWVDNGYVEP